MLYGTLQFRKALFIYALKVSINLDFMLLDVHISENVPVVGFKNEKVSTREYLKSSMRFRQSKRHRFHTTSQKFPFTAAYRKCDTPFIYIAIQD